MFTLSLSRTLRPLFFLCSLFLSVMDDLDCWLVAKGTAPCLLHRSEAGRCEIHNMMARMGSKQASISKPRHTAISSNHENCRGDYLHFNRVLSCTHIHTCICIHTHTHKQGIQMCVNRRIMRKKKPGGHSLFSVAHKCPLDRK